MHLQMDYLAVYTIYEELENELEIDKKTRQFWVYFRDFLSISSLFVIPIFLSMVDEVTIK